MDDIQSLQKELRHARVVIQILKNKVKILEEHLMEIDIDNKERSEETIVQLLQEKDVPPLLEYKQ